MATYNRARAPHSGRGWLSTGWRRSAAVNIVLMSTSMLVLIGVLVAAMSKTRDPLMAWKFYEAECASGRTTATNIMLHLLLNILSTVVLASSNFFMQVLNAPSRKELDKAHARGDWLDIGIPSWRNAFRLSPFKTIAWLSLFFSSIPIHMFFNSSVFQMDHIMGDFHLTVSSESFLQGDSYLLPGASLITGDMFISNDSRTFARIGYPSEHQPPFRDFAKNSVTELAFNVSDAATRGAEWQRLETEDCIKMYADDKCSGLRDYRNLVLVVNGTGWQRSNLWNLSDAGDTLWEPVIPKDETNSLWFSTQCSMSGTISANLPTCTSNCTSMFGYLHGPWYIGRSSWYFRNPVYSDKTGYKLETSWNTSLYSAPGNGSTFGYRTDTAPLEVSHCMAEPRNPICSVALSQPLLIAVIVSIFVKVLTCVIVMYSLGHQESLVTPGDAVASFISEPEAHVGGLMSQDDVRKKKKTADVAYDQLGPRQWTNQQLRRASSVPRPVWGVTYSILNFGLVAAITCLWKQLHDGISLQWMKVSGAPDRVISAVDNGSAFISSVLVANVPQLYLSFWYLAFNSTITRLEMSQEWALFSTKYYPLRVTSPRGKQVSTYRLQLPYRYSIPLIIASIILHWLLSNALFVIVSQGNYYDMSSREMAGGYKGDATRLPPDATVALGTASLPVLMLIIVGLIMLVVLVIVARKRLPGYMPVVGSNSLAIAAACRVSSVAKVPVDGLTEENRQDTELEELVPASKTSPRENSFSERKAELGDMACCPLKWGEVEMPEEWYQRVEVEGQLGHLSFGTVLDDPKPPTEGRWYM